MISHKCSYYCQPPIHAVECVVSKGITEWELKAYFLIRPSVVDVLSVTRVQEVDKAFIERAAHGVAFNGQLISWLCIVHFSDDKNIQIMEQQSDIEV